MTAIKIKPHTVAAERGLMWGIFIRDNNGIERRQLADLCRGRHDIYGLYPMPSLRSTWGYANHPSSTEHGNILTR